MQSEVIDNKYLRHHKVGNILCKINQTPLDKK